MLKDYFSHVKKFKTTTKKFRSDVNTSKKDCVFYDDIMYYRQLYHCTVASRSWNMMKRNRSKPSANSWARMQSDLKRRNVKFNHRYMPCSINCYRPLHNINP